MSRHDSDIQNTSRAQLTENFLTLMNCARLPSSATLMSFLENHGLGCFVKPDALLKPIVAKDQDASENHRQIFCLPVSSKLSNDFIEKLTCYLSQTTCPVILYWAWQLPENNNVVALRIQIEHHNHSLLFKTDIQSPIGAHFAVSPVQKLIRRLSSKGIGVIAEAQSSNAAAVGDEPYWAALSLFLKLSQEDATGYQNDFKIWREKQKSWPQYLAEHLLSFVPYASSRLFYAEKGVDILRMGCFQNITHQVIPPHIRNLPMVNVLRIIAISELLYHKNNTALYHIPLFFALHYITMPFRKKMTAGLSGIFLFFLGQLISTVFQLTFNSYLQMPNNLTGKNIDTPYYIFQWMTLVIQESIKLPLQLIGMMIFFALTTSFAQKLFHKNIAQTDNNQTGLHAISFFVMQQLGSLIEPYLFRFNRWVLPQKSESFALSLLSRSCQEPCSLEIKTSLASRLWQQAFSGKQAVEIKAQEGGMTAECQLRITTHSTKNCSDYQLDCQSRFFEPDRRPYRQEDVFALAKAPVKQTVFPAEKLTDCEPEKPSELIVT